MTAGLPPENRSDVEALVADRYLDALLAAGDRGADDAPVDAGLDPETRRAVVLLRRALVRVHPSFRFEERLAARLAELADARTAARGRADGIVVAFPPPARGTRQDAADPLLPRSSRARSIPLTTRSRTSTPGLPAPAGPLLVGGAITSAALSLVGVAWVAWRATQDGARATSTRQPPVSTRFPAALGVSPDARPLPDLPLPPRGVSRGDVDALPVVRGAAVQQAAREGDERVPVVRPPLPPAGAGPLSAAARRGLVRGAGRRPRVGGPARVRRPEGLPGSPRRRPAGDGAARRRGLGVRADRGPADRDPRHGLRVHGRVDGRGGGREGGPRGGGARSQSACRWSSCRRRAAPACRRARWR